ncbi:MAG: ribose-phosphate pyrophosphokinase [Acidobacteria bacterium]|nr:ribose-phosphate pyrophosphokinase [Acidobacteriota bacterium]
MDDLCLFALNASLSFGEKTSQRLGISLSPHEEREFEDGEHKSRPLVSVRKRDVFVIQSLYSEPRQSVNDKLCRLLFFIGALHDASAREITAVIPYLGYSRKDRRTKSRDPVTTRYVACLLESVGVDRVMTVDVHNLAAFQNAFRCPTEHLESTICFVEYFQPLIGTEDVTVVSPDAGGFKRADRFREALSAALGKQVPLAFINKQRSEGEVSGDLLVGDVRAGSVVILDDLISTGTTLVRAARLCVEAGAARVYCAATHGLFIPPAAENLTNSHIEKTVVSDTVPPFRLDASTVERKLAIVEVSGLIAEAVQRIHQGFRPTKPEFLK